MPDSAKLAPPAWRKRLYLPSYRVAEAARLAGVSTRTVASWHYGYPSSRRARGEPTLPGKAKGSPLSYLQLVEVAFVKVFRDLGFSLKEIREAHEYLARMFQAEHPFAELQLKTDGVRLLKDFAESEGLRKEFVVVSQQGQLMWPEMVTSKLTEFEYDAGLAMRWHPRGNDVPIVVDPRVAFGAPMIEGTGVPTWVIKERREAGEGLDDIADDFAVSPDEIAAALRFEGADLALVA